MATNIALAGNPNSGKTTLFNELTGARQHVGNYPGVTVEKKQGSKPSVLLATEYLEMSQVELAKVLKLSQPAVSQSVNRGRAIAEAESYSF